MPNLHMSERESQSFLADRHIGVMSMTRGNHQPPLTTPVWYHYQRGGRDHVFHWDDGANRKENRADPGCGCLEFLRTARRISLQIRHGGRGRSSARINHRQRSR